MNVTVAYQKSADTSDMLGAGEAYDGEGATYGTTGTGLGFSGTFGPASVGLTIANAATADVGSPSLAAASNSTAASTMGLGVKLDLGDIQPFLSYGTYKADGSLSLNGVSYSGNEIGTKYMLVTDSIVLYIGNYEEITTTGGELVKPSLSPVWNLVTIQM